MDIKELYTRKRELELRLYVAIEKELELFVEDTGVHVSNLLVPILTFSEMGNPKKTYKLGDVAVGLDV